VTVAVLPLAALDEQQGPARWARNRYTPEQAAENKAAFEQEQQRKEVEFQKLNEESSLEDYLEFVNGSYPTRLDDAGAERALAGASRVKSRQSNAIMLLNGFKIDRLDDLWRLDLEATPELCAAYGVASSATPRARFHSTTLWRRWNGRCVVDRPALRSRAKPGRHRRDPAARRQGGRVRRPRARETVPRYPGSTAPGAVRRSVRPG